MLEERNSSFSIRNVLIQFLFVALFIFVLIWLFPMKSDLKNAVDGMNKDNVSVLYDQVFNNNIVAMKEAAKSYYTTPRLPKVVGEKVKMTLGDMLERKIILPFVDREGQQCDLVDSYVEITKYEEEFVMKINLKCGEQENYLLVYMGCYDYCQTAICEKNEPTVKPPVINPPIVKPEPKPDPKPDPKPEKIKQFEYLKKTDNSYWEESDWSEYSTEKVTADKYTSVRIKTIQQKVLIGYNVTTITDKSKPVYSTKIVPTGTETILVCNKYDYVASLTASTSDEWVYVGLETYYERPSKAGYKYEFVRFVDESCTENCSSTVGRVYKVYKKSTKNTSEYKCVDSAYKTIQLSTEVSFISGYQTITKKDPVYEMREVKMYSFKTRKYIASEITDSKWSTYNDRALLDAGYEYTGEIRYVDAVEPAK